MGMLPDFYMLPRHSKISRPNIAIQKAGLIGSILVPERVFGKSQMVSISLITTLHQYLSLFHLDLKTPFEVRFLLSSIPFFKHNTLSACSQSNEMERVLLRRKKVLLQREAHPSSLFKLSAHSDS